MFVSTIIAIALVSAYALQLKYIFDRNRMKNEQNGI